MSKDNNYKKVSSLDDVYNDICSLTQESVYNLVYHFEISYNDLKKIDKETKAYQDALFWQNETCPQHLHFTHKQFFKESGLDHIKNELHNRPYSKRALISLMSQDKINNSGDNPIPSFMIAQYAKENEILYSTFYYRALETSSFLRINLAEFCIMALQVAPSSIDVIRGTIIAFLAYQQKDFNLTKNELNSITGPNVLKVLNDKTKFRELLQDFKKPSSAVSSDGIKTIISWLEDKDSKDYYIKNKNLTNRYAIECFNNLEKKITELQSTLKKTDQFSRINDIRNELNEIIDKIINLL